MTQFSRMEVIQLSPSFFVKVLVFCTSRKTQTSYFFLHQKCYALNATLQNEHFFFCSSHATAYVNCLPAGTAVIEVGNNLHLILSKGTFPVTASASAVTTVLTPIGQVQTGAGGLAKENYLLPVVTAAQRCRTAATVLIPAPARKPAPTAAFPSAHPAPAAPTTAPAGHTSVKVQSFYQKPVLQPSL